MWRFLKKLEIELPYDPAIPLLGICTKETRSERDTCTPMFIAALFIIARTWKQPRCPSADEWIRKLWYIYAMEYYSAPPFFYLEFLSNLLTSWVSLIVQLVKNPPAIQETPVRFLGWDNPLKKGKATHSSILAWKIP